MRLAGSRAATPVKHALRGWPAIEGPVRRLYARALEDPPSRRILARSGGLAASDASPAGRFCGAPFRQADLYEYGHIGVCCVTWLPTTVGDLNRDSLAEAWNSETAQAIRESIFDGSFRYCDHAVCPRIQSGELPTLDEASRDPELGPWVRQRRVKLDRGPTFINLCNDPSCNLRCPSCRAGTIQYTTGPDYARRKRLMDKLVDEVFAAPTARRFTLNVTGSGDPFGSRMFREFLFGLDGDRFPNLKINLQTNGVLFTPETWRRIGKIHRNLQGVLVSFDAASEATYAITRPPGRWDVLLENTAHLVERRRAGDFDRLRLDFVVQADNFTEMSDFVRLGRRLGVDQVSFSLVVDWETWPEATFREKCIWRRDHPRFADFLDILREPLFDDPFVDLGNLTAYRELAVDA